jgi:hypothetical protein
LSSFEFGPPCILPEGVIQNFEGGGEVLVRLSGGTSFKRTQKSILLPVAWLIVAYIGVEPLLHYFVLVVVPTPGHESPSG